MYPKNKSLVPTDHYNNSPLLTQSKKMSFR